VIVAVTDTHPLIRYATGKFDHIGKKALQVFQSADRGDGNGLVYIPTICLAESFAIMQAGKINLRKPFDHWVQELSRISFLPIYELTTEIVVQASKLPQISDPFDKLITATAMQLEYPLITQDDKIHRANVVEILWDE
jgi:PIN domain nuclease of toxin-antitoxin system